MKLQQVLRGMAQYLRATTDPIDRERWALTLDAAAELINELFREREILRQKLELESWKITQWGK